MAWLILAMTVLCAANAIAQAQDAMPEWQKKAGGTMEFEVASVKQNKGDKTRPDVNFPLGPGDVYEPVGGLFHATNLPAIVYINFAYKVSANQGEALMKQLPEWVRTDRFDIEAHAEGTPTKDQMRLMMQALLKERFGFTVHYEMREAPVLALRVAKPGEFGTQLRPHPTNAVCTNQFPEDQAGHIAPPQGPQADTGRFPAVCGGIVGMPPTTPGTVAMGARNITMKLFADSISGIGQLGRPVLDGTGLAGTYDFWLEWTPPSSSPTPQESSASPPDNAGPSFIEALKEQLGLKLESQKGQVEEIIVEHIDHPSPN